ncbi:978_t:CDS:2, partial [Ambispora leptoticha]
SVAWLIDTIIFPSNVLRVRCLSFGAAIINVLRVWYSSHVAILVLPLTTFFGFGVHFLVPPLVYNNHLRVWYSLHVTILVQPLKLELFNRLTNCTIVLDGIMLVAVSIPTRQRSDIHFLVPPL